MAEQSKEAKDLGFSFSSVTDAVNKFRNPVQALSKEVSDSVGTFNKLSSTGNAFNNDVIGMKVAAANTRMTLDDLTQVVTDNGKTFAGLGGSVAKGSQVFTDFSKTFFDSGLTENLRQMGYSSKDLNEVLATQIGFQKSTTDTSVQGQIRTAAATAALAEEMDLVAKLTGKSRKEQEAQLEESKKNGQIEAKFRLIGLEKGAEKEAEARANFAKQLTQAQAMGTEKVFTEMFATGTVRSKEAAMQMALLGGASRETANSAKALAQGNAAASQAAMDSAKVYNMENQKNAALLRITAIGMGEAGNVMKKNIETNDAAFQGLAKTQKAAEAMGVELSNTAEAMKLQKKAIEDEQKARHGITSTIVASQARGQDFNAAIANQLIKPLNEGKIAEQAKAFAESISQGVKATDSSVKQAEVYLRSLARQPGLGGPGEAPASARERMEAVVPKDAVKTLDKVVGGGIEGFGNVVGKTVGFVADAMKVYQINTSQVPSRDAGTMGKTGQPFEPTDLIAKIHKGEMVLTPEQAKKFMEGAKTDGITSAINDMTKSMPKMEVPKEMSEVFSGVSKSMPKIEFPKEMSDALSDMTKSMPGIDISKVPGSIDVSDVKKSVSKILPESQKTTADAAPSKFKMPSMDQISFGPDGMPKITAKPQATAMANTAAAEKKAQQEKQTPAAQPKDESPSAATAKETKADMAATGKTATLDDVVKSLNSLNNTMVQVLKTSSETTNLVERQVKATKAIGGNVYDRMS